MSTARSPHLIGRREELATGLRLVHLAARGEGSTLLIRGEAGIGKSRLATELRRRAAAAGLIPLTGRAIDGGGAYRALAEALARPLRRPLPDTAALRPHHATLRRWITGAPAARRLATTDPLDHGVDQSVVLGEALIALLDHLGRDDRRRGCLLLLEDLHWADPDTLDLLRYLADAVHETPVLVVLTARDEVAHPDVEALAAGSAVTTVRLGRFGPDDVAALAAACRAGVPPSPSQLDRLLACSDGLPFLVEELLDEEELHEGSGPRRVPPTLAALVRRRLTLVRPQQGAVLAAAAVMTGEPDHRLLARVLDVPDVEAAAALRAGTDAGLLIADHGRLRWRHALTRAAVLDTLVPPERATLSSRAARVLEADPDPGRRELAAELYAAAGETRRSVELLVALARDDAARGALRGAADLLARAEAAGPPDPLVVLERVQLLTALGRAAEALEVGESALDVGLVRGDDHAALCLRLARAAVVTGSWDAAQQYVERAGRPGDALSMVIAADAAYGSGDVDRAASLTRVVLAAIDPAEPALRCEALIVLARSQFGANVALSRRALGLAAQLAAEHGLTPWRIQTLFVLGSREYTDGDPTAPSLAAARELGERTGALTQVVQAELLQADAVSLVEGPRAALPLLLRTAERAGRLRLTGLQAMAEVMAAANAALLGDDDATSGLLEAARARPHAPAEARTLAPMVLALPYLLQRDLATAVRLADAGVGELLHHRSAAPTQWFGLWALLRTVASRNDGSALATLQEHHTRHSAVNRAALQYGQAVLAGRAGRDERAADLLRRADADLAKLPWWRLFLRLQVLAAAASENWGHPVPELRADLAVHELVGPAPLARTCRDLLRAAGARTPRRSRHALPPELSAVGITAREAEVLDLVASGLTNAQTAERLFLSTRTVDTHVARLLAKTGSADRSALRRWAVTAGQGRQRLPHG